MAEEEKKQKDVTTEITPTTEELLTQLEKMKKETVPLDKYTKALEENKVLVNQIINGQSDDENNQEVVYSDEELNKLREELFDTEKHDLTNLEYCAKALALRDGILQKSGGKVDVFVGTHNQFEPSQDDYYRAENTAETFRECIAYANGDSQLFTQELQRRMGNRR